MSSLTKAETIRWLRQEHTSLGLIHERLASAAEETKPAWTPQERASSRRERKHLYQAADAVDNARDAIAQALDDLDITWDAAQVAAETDPEAPTGRPEITD